MEHGFHAGEQQCSKRSTETLQTQAGENPFKVVTQVRKHFVDICCEQSAALEDYTPTIVCGMLPAHEE